MNKPAAQQLAPSGVIVNNFELDDNSALNEDDENNRPAKVEDLKKQIREADALLIVTAEYSHSIPGVLKNAKAARTLRRTQICSITAQTIVEQLE